MTQEHDQSDATMPGSADEPAGEAAHSPMHVAWLATDDTLARFARSVGPLVVGLSDELVATTLFRSARAEAAEALAPTVPTVRYPDRRLFGPGARATSFLAEKVRSEKIDLLHALDADSADLAAVVAREAGVRYVVSSHRLGDGAALGTLGPDCAAVLASSTAIRNDLIERHVAAAEKVHLARPGMYRVRYPLCFTETGRSIAIVAGGPMASFRAWEAVLRTFAELQLREFDCAFFILGSGPGQRAARRLARELDLLGRVTFADEQVASQFSGIIKAADVYISAAPSSVLDVRALMAMANGSAVLAARDPTADFIIDGRTALVFTQGDHTELTTKLVAMLDDHPAARALAAVALTYVGEHHTPAAAIAALGEIYRTSLQAAILTRSA